MNNVLVFNTNDQLLSEAAARTIAALQSAVKEYGSAVWVVAGGATPLDGYKIIADNYSDALDWSKVTTVMGDERIGPLDGPDNNWHLIDQILGKLPITKIFPQSDQPIDHAVLLFEQQLASLPQSDSNSPRLDVVWLGVGEDGHTLSLFPRHESLLPTGGLATPVHDSPKPPADRISLTLRALQGATKVMIIAGGHEKQAAIESAIKGDHSPIALAASIAETHGGTVTWLLDNTAAPND